jgi:hypothetical protein
MVTTIKNASEYVRKGPNGNGSVSKIDRYGWKMVDERGMFEWISKERLNVDETYQRNASAIRIAALASEWSWTGCGCLIVGMRPDGSLWVIDGQHRKLAADRRSDVKELPCLIFEGEPSKEAKGFISANCNRKALSMIEKMNALVMSGDPVAVQMKAEVEASGYKLMAGRGRHYVGCAALLYSMFGKDAALARRVWKLAVDLHEGEQINQNILGGLWHLECRLVSREIGQSIFDRHNTDALHRIGVKALNASIDTCAAYYGARTATTTSRGIADALNRGRTSRRINLDQASTNGTGKAAT